MPNPEQQRVEEEAALEIERCAFERRQAAVFYVQRQFLPYGNGQPTEESMRELEEADASLQIARSNVDRIIQQIRTGERR